MGFPYKETNDYAAAILAHAGSPPQDASPEATFNWLLPSVIHRESNGNPDAVSPKGALGRLQVMPATAADPGYGIAPAKDHSPGELERVGQGLLLAMIKRYPGRPDLALAAYNAGTKPVDLWQKQGLRADGTPSMPQQSAIAGQSPFRPGAGFVPGVIAAGNLGELQNNPDKPAIGAWQFIKDAFNNDNSLSALYRWSSDAGYDADPNFDISKIPAKQWSAITHGLTEDAQVRLGSVAVNMDHLQTLADRARDEQHAEEEMATWGGWGIAGRFALGLTDPTNILLMAGSGGLGVAARGERLLAAARMATKGEEFAVAARALDDVQQMTNVSKFGQLARGTAQGAAENMAITSIINHDNINRDGWDVVHAGLLGGFLGGVGTGLFRGKELNDLKFAYLREKQTMELAELESRIRPQQAALETQLKWLHSDHDVAAAQSQLKDIEQQVATVKAQHADSLKAAADEYRQGLSNRASNALKRSELGALTREVSSLTKAHAAAQGLPAQIEARMLKDDIANLGQEAALSKHPTKMRQRAAAKEAKVTQDNIAGQKAAAEDRLAQAQDGQDALQNLRKMERRERAYPGDHLSHLPSDMKDTWAEKELAMVQRTQSMLDNGQKDVDAATAAREATRASIEGQMKDLESLRQRGVQASDRSMAADLQNFGPDSAGAARFLGFTESVHPEIEGKSGLPSGNPIVRMGAEGWRGKVVNLMSFREGPFATMSMILNGSPDEVVRNNFGRMLINSIGNVDGSPVATSAEEIAHTLRVRMETRFTKEVGHHFKDWAERNGYGAIARAGRIVREEYMRAVGRHIRGQLSDDVGVQKAAQAMRGIYRDYLKEAKDAGIKGFEDVDPNTDYLPRVFDFHSLPEIEDAIGTPGLKLLIQRAIQHEYRLEGPVEGDGVHIMGVDKGGERVYSEMSDKTSGRIADAYVKTMKKLRVGANVSLMTGVKWDDVGFLRKFLGEAGVGDEEINGIVDEFAALNKRRNRQQNLSEGTPRYAKHRQQFDENYGLDFKDQRALNAGRDENIHVKVSDLFENNVEALFGRYNRTMSGHVGLANIGFKSKGDFETAMMHVENALERNEKELARVKKNATAAYSLLTGTPISEVNDVTHVLRNVRDYNFLTTMDQSGWSQFPDLAGLLAKGNLGFTMKYFPEIFGTVKRDAAGNINHEFYREMEEVLGVGTDLYNNRIYSSYDWGEQGEGLTGFLGKSGHAMRVGGRAVQYVSGLGGLTAVSQRLAGRVLLQRLVKDVTHGGELAPHRAAALGLSEEIKPRIAAQLKQHTDFATGDFGGEIRRVNWAKWDDVEARDSLLHALAKETRRVIQEGSLGDTALWMHSDWGRVLMQFRNFAAVSYTKQLLHGIAHADAEEFTRFMMSGVLAAAAYKARHETNLALKVMAGMPPEDEQKYREKFLSADRFAAAAIANGSYSSLLPGIWDTAQSTATGTRFFDTRTSGLGSDLVTGNPTYSLASGVGRAISGSAQSLIRGDRQFDQTDAAAWRRILPFQNVLGMDVPYTALTHGLPQKDHDPDPKTIDWWSDDNPQ